MLLGTDAEKLRSPDIAELDVRQPGGTITSLYRGCGEGGKEAEGEDSRGLDWQLGQVQLGSRKGGLVQLGRVQLGLI